MPGRPARPAPTAAPRTARAGSARAIIVVVVAVLVAVLLRTFVVQTFFIPSGSMEPTLQIGDRILVNKLSYHLHGVGPGRHRGLLAAAGRELRRARGERPRQAGHRAARRRRSRSRGGYVYIDGKRLDESWLPASEQGVTRAGPGGHALQPRAPLPRPGQRLLRDGRQPHRLVRQPLLGPHSQVAHRGQGRRCGSGRSRPSTSSDARSARPGARSPPAAQPSSASAVTRATAATVWPSSRFMTRTPVASRPCEAISRACGPDDHAARGDQQDLLVEGDHEGADHRAPGCRSAGCRARPGRRGPGG